MAVKHFSFNLTATPIELTGLIGTDKRRGQTIIFNSDKLSSDACMIGGPTVTDTSYGIHLDADDQFTLSGDFTSADRFYARAKNTSALLHVLVVGA